MRDRTGGRKERIDRGVKARTDDIFAVASLKDALYLILPRAVPITALILLALFSSPYQQKILVISSVFAMLAVSWDLLAMSGLISLGQALFFGVGAYLSGAMNLYLGWPLWLVLPLAALLGGLICAVLLAPVVRLRGIYFAMVTLALPLLLVRVIEAAGILGGTVGLSGLTPFPSQSWELWIAVLVFLFSLFGLRRLMNQDYGIVLQAIRDDDRAVLSDGVNVYRLKIQALFIAGTIGGFAGAFMTHVYVFVGMPAFALDYSILPIAAAVVGGSGTLAGPALGAFLLVPLSEALRPLGSLRIVAYGVFLVVFVALAPEGLFPFLRRKYHLKERFKQVDHER